MFRQDVGDYSGAMWRVLRMAILLLVLVLVGGGTILDRWRTTDWDSPLRIGIFPINADGRRVTSDYVDALRTERFADIEGSSVAKPAASGSCSSVQWISRCIRQPTKSRH